ncbi:structural maintenance of chromosomes protein 6B-like [Vigna umbellata]|uniref:structural maintenance of chromosomes protein 6B-like n=1 Tax=Vigna umbellata TaxID=87088 RepID=UPI001F5F04AA|nr:structural maintenance of chromosomes protein 6B-like [Vigna umbellata]
MKRGRGESMGESSSRVSPTLQNPTAGIIKRLRLENFMCHSKHETEFGNHVNFITGQNGSGKSAILTALCVAFGCRAKGTQRASTLKDFIKNGASNAVIQVEIQNEGEDAFKPEIYGRVINVERRISESASSTTLKDHLGVLPYVSCFFQY